LFVCCLTAHQESYRDIAEPLGSHVVNCLLSVVDDPPCHTVMFDNFFTSLELMRTLRQHGFGAIGTIRENRLRDCPILNSLEMKKRSRGSFEFQGDGEVIVTVRKDSKSVYVVSNCYGVTPTVSKRRFSATDIKHMQVTGPKIIDYYNKSMGGVDLVDRFLSEYRPTMSGKKWWWYVFYTHVLNICCVAAWRVHQEVGGAMDC